jgi:hypothetical protein
MKAKWFAVSALALALGTTSGLAHAKAYGQGAPVPGYQEGGGRWDAPPQEFRDAQRQGFQDGIEGARKDFGNHRQMNVNNREEFRHPSVDRAMRHDYREGFRKGYERASQHMMMDNRDHDRHDRDDHDHNDPH